MKIAINKSHGGFNISEAAEEFIIQKSGANWNGSRTCEFLVQAIEELQDKAAGSYSQLRVIVIPDDINYIIEDYDGAEWIAEAHRTWH
jgi:hypothetical protein